MFCPAIRTFFFANAPSHTPCFTTRQIGGVRFARFGFHRIVPR